MNATTTRMRRLAGTAAVALVVVASGLLAGAPAASASSYRYWTYWQGDAGSWTFATAGPASLVPDHGSVEGWRFAVTTRSGSASDAPRQTPSFADVCGQAAPAAGNKAVALIVDPGPPQAAPDGQVPPAGLVACVEIADDATGYQVLRSALEVRTEGGLVCGIDGYPSGECAPVVDDPPASAVADATASLPPDTPSIAASAVGAEPGTDPSGPGAPWATIAVAVLLAGGVGLAMWRRRA